MRLEIRKAAGWEVCCRKEEGVYNNREVGLLGGGLGGH